MLNKIKCDIVTVMVMMKYGDNQQSDQCDQNRGK